MPTFSIPISVYLLAAKKLNSKVYCVAVRSAKNDTWTGWDLCVM